MLEDRRAILSKESSKVDDVLKCILKVKVLYDYNTTPNNPSLLHKYVYTVRNL